MPDSLTLLIDKGATQLGLSLSDQQLKQLVGYLELLQKWNRTFNLTAITDPVKMVSYHLLDSLVLTKYINSQQQSFVDIGSGAGLPGIPLAIVFPDKNFTLLDSNGKKTRFMMQSKIELGLTNCSVEHCRIEDFQPSQLFDVVMSRAFSNITDFVTGGKNLIGTEGRFFAMKGKLPDQEILAVAQGDSAQVVDVYELQVPFLPEPRHLVILKNKV